MTTDVAVVVVNYNGERLLPDCLAAVRAQTLAPAEVLIADNGSRDGSLALLRAHHPDVGVVELGRNHGFAGGANRGVAATRAPWVCVLNSDATPAPDWLARLIGGGARPADVGARQRARQRGHGPDRERRRPVRAAGLCLQAAARPATGGAAARAVPGVRRARRRARLPARRLRAARRLRGRFFLYYEDVDLAFRAVLAGYHALLVPDARVVHRLGATTKSLARARFYVARNSVWCAVRCLPQAGVPQLARRWASELRTNRPRRLIGVELAGRAAALAGLPRALRERRAIQDARVAGLDEIGVYLRPPQAIAEVSQRAARV